MHWQPSGFARRLMVSFNRSHSTGYSGRPPAVNLSRMHALAHVLACLTVPSPPCTPSLSPSLSLSLLAGTKMSPGGNPEGAFALANWILDGKGGLTYDPAEAAKLLEVASANGLHEAHTLLGILLNEGMGVMTDYKRAASLFEKAAALGDLKAMYNLGVLQIEGKGVSAAQSKGMDNVRRAATGGVAQAQFTVSIWYRDGALGTKQDFKKEYQSALKAANQDHSQVPPLHARVCV